MLFPLSRPRVNDFFVTPPNPKEGLPCYCGHFRRHRKRRHSTINGDVLLSYCPLCRIYRDSRKQSFTYTQDAGFSWPPTPENYSEQAKRINRYVRFIRSHVIPNGKAIDVGCHSGFLVSALNGQGWVTSGVELNSTCVNFARGLGLSVQRGSIDDLNNLDSTFNLITITHVLEHLENLKEGVEILFRALKPAGVLFVAVPNYGCRTLRLIYRGRLDCFQPDQHIWYFAKDSLRRLCEKFGFEMIAMRSEHYITPHSLIPFGKAAKKVLLSWLHFQNDGSEILGLFRKPWQTNKNY